VYFVTCFNGATSNQTWKLPHTPKIGCKGVGFNGATSNQTWKLFEGIQVVIVINKASMGPRPIRRGNEAKKRAEAKKAVLQWGHVQSDVETPFIHATPDLNLA